MASRSALYAKALFDSWEIITDHERGKMIDRFIEVLRADRMLPLTPSIISSVEQLVLDKEKTESVTAEFAHQPTGHQRESLNKFQVTEVRETPAVIGGFRVVGRNKIIDASVRGGLEQVQRALSIE